MKMLIIPIVLILILLSSCGEKKKTSVKITSSFEISASNMDMVLVAKNETKNLYFSKVITGSETISLENGKWEFSIVSWDKTSHPTMEGPQRCGRAQADLSLVSEVTIDIDAAKCVAFANSAYLLSGEFQDLKINSCSTLASVTNGYSTCGAGAGQSHKVFVLPFTEMPEMTNLGGPLISNCLVGAVVVSSVRVPVQMNAPMKMMIRSYPNSNCTDSAIQKDFIFNNGLTETVEAKVYDATSGDTAIFLNDPPVNSGPMAANLPVSMTEDIQSLITLNYTDTEGDLATSCSVSNLVNVIETTACSCLVGVCKVGITGLLDFNGAGSFNYTVSTNETSNVAVANLTVTAVNDPPILTFVGPTSVSTNVDTSITIPIQVYDPDGPLSCTVAYFSVGTTNPALVSASQPPIGGTYPNCFANITPMIGATGSLALNFVFSDGVLYDTKSLTLSILPTIPFLSYTYPQAVIGSVLTPITITPQVLQANGLSISNCVITPALPSGLSINPTTCIITGTPILALSPTTYQVMATNSVGTSAPAQVTIQIN